MSQHLFETQCNDQAVLVLMGWDRPLQGFFMVIELTDRDEEYLYSNLEDRSLAQWMGLPPTLDPFLAQLAELGIAIPQLMIDEIKADARRNVGNRHVYYNADGTIAS